MNSKTDNVIYPLDYPICLTQPLRLDDVSAWIEHIPFGMFIIGVLRPKILVELGTHTGVSYSAFCQAIKQLDLDTRCYAIDTWAGDSQAGFYGADILANLHAYHDPLYGDFSQLLQSTFDDAVNYFADNSIDLLHIDGLHTYDAVKHDFENWLPKLTKHAIVLFHDTNVRERDFGVWQFWAELQQNYPHFEFLHGHGLGVLCVGSEPTPELKPLFSIPSDETIKIREFFFTLGFRLSTTVQNKKLIFEKEQAIQALTTQLTEKEKQIQTLRIQLKTQEIEKKTLEIKLLPPAEPNKRIANNKNLQENRKFVIAASRFIQTYQIRTSSLFNKNWYLSKNPDVADAKIDPARHYLLFGGFEGRDPGPAFSSSWYLNTYTDVKQTGINPLIHYIKSGKKEGRKIQSHPEAIRRDPIIIHQMGKVGSKTVEISLIKAYQTLGMNVPVYHAHRLNDFENLMQQALQERTDPTDFLWSIEHGKKLRKQIDENPAQHWNIITLVRDPIARNIGTFFHNLADFIPDWYERYTEDQLKVDELMQLFLSIKSIHDMPETWFDLQVKLIPAFGIDVYSEPFPHMSGYKIYHDGVQASLLLIRTENLNECAEAAIHQFLGIEHFTLHHTNVGTSKNYADLYRTFLELPLPTEYVERIYATQFSQHFYTNKELDTFKKHWTKSTKK